MSKTVRINPLLVPALRAGTGRRPARARAHASLGRAGAPGAVPPVGHDPAHPHRGLRWPVEECFELSKDHLGLDQSQVRLYTAIARHTVLVMAALVACAVTAALLRDRTDTQAPPPVRPDQPPPADLGMIPLTVPEITRLLTTQPATHSPPGHAEQWVTWRRRHQARSRWYHQRTRLTRDAGIALVSRRMAA